MYVFRHREAVVQQGYCLHESVGRGEHDDVEGALGRGEMISDNDRGSPTI